MSTSEADRQSPILGDAPRSHLVCAPFNVPVPANARAGHTATGPRRWRLQTLRRERTPQCFRFTQQVDARRNATGCLPLLGHAILAAMGAPPYPARTRTAGPIGLHRWRASLPRLMRSAMQGNLVQLTRRDFDNEFVSLVVRQGPQSASVDPRRAMVAAKAIRRFPSINLWLRTSECNKAAAFSSTVWYGFWTYSRTACLATSCFERASRLAQARRAVASAPVRGRSMGMPRGINGDTKHGRPWRTQYGASSRSWERGATSASTAYGARVGPSWAYKGQWASAQSRSARLGLVALRKAADLGCAPASMGPDRQTGPAAARHHRPILQR